MPVAIGRDHQKPGGGGKKIERRHEDHRRLRGLDHDDLRRRCRLLDDHGLRGRRRRGFRRLHRHLDLFVGLQVAGSLRLLAKPLHGVHDVVRLRQKRVAHVANPVGALVERDQHLGKGDQ